LVSRILCVTSKKELGGIVVRIPFYKCRGPEFDSRRYHNFREVGHLELGPLSLIRIYEELLGRKILGFGIENTD
jgi:hypothetical protein